MAASEELGYCLHTVDTTLATTRTCERAPNHICKVFIWTLVLNDQLFLMQNFRLRFGTIRFRMFFNYRMVQKAVKVQFYSFKKALEACS